VNRAERDVKHLLIAVVAQVTVLLADLAIQYIRHDSTPVSQWPDEQPTTPAGTAPSRRAGPSRVSVSVSVRT
jgi:hypothetical protein